MTTKPSWGLLAPFSATPACRDGATKRIFAELSSAATRTEATNEIRTSTHAMEANDPTLRCRMLICKKPHRKPTS